MTLRLRLSILLLISTLPVMTGAVLSPALPALKAAFGGGASAQTWARWALTTPALFVALGAPLAGLLADRMGRRPVLLGSLLLFAGGGSAGALLGSLPAITATRAVLGLAAGGLGTTATTLIVDYYDESQSQILGGQAAVMALAAMIYTVLGGVLADLSWRAPFGVYLLGLVILGPAALLPEPTSASEHREDSASAAPETSVPWKRIGLLYGLAFLGLAIFNLIRVELPYYLRAMGMTSGLRIGAVLSGGTVTGALASFAYDRVQSRLGVRGTLSLVLALFASGFGTVALAGSPLAAVGGVALAGSGMGLLVPSLTDGVGEAAPPSMRGRLMGGLSTLRNLGRFASPLLTMPALLGAGAAAPFVGGAVLAGGLALLLLGWMTACHLSSGLGPIPASAQETGHPQAEPHASFCNA
jgi:MFS family permease